MSDQPRRLRIAHLIVQPVLVWDDGSDLEPGPALDPLNVPLSKVVDMAERLPGEVERLAKQADAPPRPA